MKKRALKSYKTYDILMYWKCRNPATLYLCTFLTAFTVMVKSIKSTMGEPYKHNGVYMYIALFAINRLIELK